MTTSEDALRLDGPGELIETLPYLLGFHPEASIVFVGLDDQHLLVTARMDLADAVTRRIEIDTGVHMLLRAQASTAVVAVYADPGDPPMRAAPPTVALPHEQLVRQAADTLTAHGIQVVESVFVQAGYWWSYAGRASGCPDCQAGTRLPGDAAVGPAAAVFAGLQAHPNRAALAAVLDPEPDSVRRRHRAGIEAAEHALVAAALDRRTREQRSVKRALFSAAREADGSLFPRPLPDLSATALSRYAVGLSEISIRDALWLAIDQQRLDGRGFWLQLLQQLPGPYDCAPLFLFGWASWRDGNGTLAAIAAERALESSPAYTAAELLLSAVQSGLDPFRTPRLRVPRP